MTAVALLGAGGKIGLRIARCLDAQPEYEVLHVEQGEAGLGRLRDAGHAPVAIEDAARAADVVILAVPDVSIRPVAARVVPLLRPGALVVALDPAAPHACHLPERADIAYFVTHPCHPPLFNREIDPAARDDHFGGIAKQNIVCCLAQGSEPDYARGEAVARAIWAPVLRSHRVSLDQMIILEPVLSETIAATLVTVLKEAVDEAVRRGVPEAAARDFLFGHLNVELAIVFGEISASLSDGALVAIEKARAALLRPDWKSVFEPQAVEASVAAILAP